jgi:hypothetical protein
LLTYLLAGFTFAYNARLYFLTYFPKAEVGVFLTAVSIGGGAAGVLIGGCAADRAASSQADEADPTNEGNKSRARLASSRRLRVLAAALAIASPLAAAVLATDPPLAFLCILAYYFFCK